MRIAEVSAQALESKAPLSHDWLSFYREQAQSKGYLLPSGDVAGTLAAHVLRNHFGQQYLAMTGCPVAEDPRNTWPTLMFRPRNENNFATPKHVLMQVFLETGPEKRAAPTTVYRTPGKRPRDYRQMDIKTAVKVRARIQRLALAKTRMTVQALLLQVGAWSEFKHHRAQFPETAALLEEFKKSEQAERQVGGRQYWRKRLPSRYGAIGAGAFTLEAE